MPLASGVVRVAEATGEARSPSASGENRAGSSGPEKPARRWCPWAEGRAPVSWDAPGDADARWRFGARLFSADFDGGNLARVERVTDTSFHLWTRPDNQGTPHETHHRTWFHFRVDGCRAGETLTFSFPDFNKQKTLFSNDFRPTYRAHATSGSSDGGPERVPGTDGASGSCEKFHMRAYRHVREAVSARTGRDGAFRVSFKHRFDSEASVFFALSFPFSYGDVGAMLDRVDAKFRERTSHGDSMRAHVSYARSLLTTSVEGRKVERSRSRGAGSATRRLARRLDERTAAEGRRERSRREQARDDREEPDRSSRSTDQRVPASRSETGGPRRFPTCGVSDEKPRTTCLTARWSFCCARTRAHRGPGRVPFGPDAPPRRCVPGALPPRPLGQNLNRHYESPTRRRGHGAAVRRSWWRRRGKSGRVYLDLHAHANKRASSRSGTHLADGGWRRARTRSCASELAALRPEPLQLQPEEHERRQNGDCKSGTGRVALPWTGASAPVHRRGQLQLQQVAEPSDGEERRREERRAAGRGRVLLGGSSREPPRCVSRRDPSRDPKRPETKKRDHETVRPRDAARRRPRAAVGGAGPARGEPSEPRALERVRIRARRAELGEGRGERRRERRLLR